MTSRTNTTTSAARLRHAEENTADYLETIADLIATHGEARLVDIAASLGVSMTTANKKVAQLQREGFVKAQKYRSIFLTNSGSKIAKHSKFVHECVLRFLLAAGVPEEIAQADAEGLEHHCSPQTLEALQRLTAELEKSTGAGDATISVAANIESDYSPSPSGTKSASPKKSRG